MTAQILDEHRLREILDYDKETGIFVWKVMLAHRRKPGTVAGNLTHDYIEIGINNRSYRAHHLAWLYVTGQWPKSYIDHIDGNRANNAFANLREVSGQKNSQNRHWVSVNKTSSQYLGVTWNKQRGCWMAQIRATNGENINLGLYDDEYQAHVAYLYAKKDLHDDANICNQPLPPKPKKRQRTDCSISGQEGISLDKRRNTWCVRLTVDGKYKAFGSYRTIEEAVAVRDRVQAERVAAEKRNKSTA